MDQLENESDINMDQLDKDFQAFMDALANEGIIRKVIIDGTSFYFGVNDPQYKEYLDLKESGKEKEFSEIYYRYAS